MNLATSRGCQTPKGDYVVGGFNPFERHESKWGYLPQIGVKI